MTEMGKPVPKRLGKEPLLEAVWEIRFSSDKESVADLLPGLIYQAMQAAYPKIERLPAANLPITMLQQDETLRYVPTIRLLGDLYAIQIGEHVVSLSCRRPYTGWKEFGAKILELAELLRSTNLLNRPDRFSLKAIDVIQLPETPSLKPLRVMVKMGTLDLIHNPVQLRTEIRENGFINIVQIATPAQVVLLTGERFSGLLIDIDTICHLKPEEFWKDFPKLLDRAHDICKGLFFRLLTQETIDQLEPEY